MERTSESAKKLKIRSMNKRKTCALLIPSLFCVFVFQMYGACSPQEDMNTLCFRSCVQNLSKRAERKILVLTKVE